MERVRMLILGFLAVAVLAVSAVVIDQRGHAHPYSAAPDPGTQHTDSSPQGTDGFGGLK